MKLFLSSAAASFCTSLADMGNAEMPAAPIMGFSFRFRNRLIAFAESTPTAVSRMKATSPMERMRIVWGWMNRSPVMVAEMASPRRMVTMLASSFWAPLASRSTTPLSRRRLPNMRKPISDAEGGANIPAARVMPMGKRIFAFLGTGFSW